MHVLMITSEATPFAQTGGLAEVMAALPLELGKLGVDVDVLLPKYRGIDHESYPVRESDIRIELTLNAKAVRATLWSLEAGSRVRYLFLQCNDYYDREHLYGTPDGDYEDNAERFVFLSRSALEMALATGTRYEVYHSHDWQAALAPVYLRTLYAGEPLLDSSASVITIHNLGYQGIFWHLDMPLVGVGWEFFTPKYMEFHGKLNFLKSGIVFAEEVNTVSPGYREEILTPEFGFGLEGVLREKGEHLTGILNGVDYHTWNPETDPLIAARYSAKDPSQKALCKSDLQKIAGLPVRAETPVIGMVTRLSDQKGVDQVHKAFHSLVQHDLQFVILGTGEARYHDAFGKLEKEVPDKARIFLAFDNELAHKIFAGADMLLVPSRYEPCGLNQLYALRYGTVPIVRATGGLIDTVDDFDPARNAGTGFKFVDPTPSTLKDAVLRSVRLYKEEPQAWKHLMIRGMSKDFSWKRSAEAYVRLYEKAVAQRKEFLSARVHG